MNVRQYLGWFNFKGEAQQKKVRLLKASYTSNLRPHTLVAQGLSSFRPQTLVAYGAAEEGASVSASHKLRVRAHPLARPPQLLPDMSPRTAIHVCACWYVCAHVMCL